MFTRRTPLLAIVALVALMPAAAAAQTKSSTSSSSADDWKLGVTAGITSSGVSTTDDVNLSKVWGAQGGVFTTYNFNRNFSGRIEALVSQRGAKNDVSGNTVRITYFDIPLLARFGPTMTNAIHFHAFTGLTPGFRMKNNASTGGPLTSDITNDMKRFDLGWVAGASVEQGAWSLDGRYTVGLVNQNNVATGAEFKNRSLSFNIGYLFR